MTLTPAPAPAVSDVDVGRVTVILAAYTHKRLADIRAGLVALTGQTRTPDEVILVIDNNEDLAKVARTDLGALYPGLRVVDHTGKSGAGAARNTGALEATGDVLVFLDDDACPDPTWLEQMLEPMTDPTVQVTGGRARPAFPDGKRPVWFPTEFDWTVGCHPAHTPDHTHDVRNVWGVALAVRAEAFAAANGFDTQFGRVGTTPLGGEETELCIRIRQAHPTNRVVMAPAAKVTHTVPAARCRWSYLWRRCYAEGLSKSLMADTVGAGDALSAEKSYAAAVLPRAVLRGMGDAVRGDLTGLARSFAVVTGTLAAGVGYLRGRLTAAR